MLATVYSFPLLEAIPTIHIFIIYSFLLFHYSICNNDYQIHFFPQVSKVKEQVLHGCSDLSTIRSDDNTEEYWLKDLRTDVIFMCLENYCSSSKAEIPVVCLQ